MEIVLAGGVERVNLLEVHPLEELKINILLVFVSLGDVKDRVGDHTLAALL